jgi:hypothetical protein
MNDAMCRHCELVRELADREPELRTADGRIVQLAFVQALQNPGMLVRFDASLPPSFALYAVRTRSHINARTPACVRARVLQDCIPRGCARALPGQCKLAGSASAGSFARRLIECARAAHRHTQCKRIARSCVAHVRAGSPISTLPPPRPSRGRRSGARRAPTMSSRGCARRT